MKIKIDILIYKLKETRNRNINSVDVKKVLRFNGVTEKNYNYNFETIKFIVPINRTVLIDAIFSLFNSAKFSVHMFSIVF